MYLPQDVLKQQQSDAESYCFINFAIVCISLQMTYLFKVTTNRILFPVEEYIKYVADSCFDLRLGDDHLLKVI